MKANAKKNNSRKINNIRGELRGQTTFVRGVELRAELALYGEQYKPRHSPTQIVSFIKEFGNGLTIRKTHPQDSNVPYVWQLFTTKSRWVCGDSMLECFDRAIDTKHDWTRLDNKDANALILAHQAIKDARTGVLMEDDV